MADDLASLWEQSKPIQHAGGGDDLSALWEQSKPAPEQPSGGEALARGAAQGATFGFGDEINGFIQAAGAQLMGEKQGFWDSYRQNRDAFRREDKAAEDAHGTLYTVGNIAGGIPAAVALPGGSFTQGAAFGLGNSDADLTKGEPVEYLKAGGSALAGGLIGKGAELGLNKVVAPLVGKAAGAVRGAVSDAADSFANSRMLKAVGMIQKDMRGKAPEQLQEMGGRLYDELKPSFGDDAASLLEKSKEALKGRGQQIGDALDSATQSFDLTPVLRRAHAEILAPMAKNPIAARDGAKVIDSVVRLGEQAKAGPLSIAEANRIKTALDEGINWKTDPKSVTNLAKRLRGILDDEIEAQLGRANPDAATSLAEGKGLYGPLKEAVKAGKGAVQREQGNRFVSLTDHLVGLGSSAAMGPIGALGAGAMALINKMARERGPAIAAIAGKNLAAMMGKPGTVSKAAALVAENPTVLGRYGAMLEKALEESSPDAFHALHAAIEQSDPEYREKVAAR